MSEFFKKFISPNQNPRLVRALLLVFLVLATGASVFIYTQANSFVQHANLENLVSQQSETSDASGVISATTSNTDTVTSGSTSSTSKTKSSSANTGSNSASGSTPTAGSGSTGSGNNTPQPESLSATVAFYADSQSDTDGEDLNHQRVVNYILTSPASVIFHGGDLLEDGTTASRDRFNAVTATLRLNRTFYAAQGNNERNSAVFFDNFTFPGNEHWYSVNVGNLHMIVLDNYASSVSVDSEQYSWLQSDLQSAASQSRLTGVIFHYPIYGGGGDYKNMIGTVVPLFRNYGVDFVVSGHEHVYQHNLVDGIHYFVLSGQPSLGYSLAQIYSSYLNLNFYNSDNANIGNFTINNR